MTKGGDGAEGMRAVVMREPEDSPLYGFIRFRRRSVLVKYVPEATSRVLKGELRIFFFLSLSCLIGVVMLMCGVVGSEMSGPFFAGCREIHAPRYYLYDLISDGVDRYRLELILFYAHGNREHQQLKQLITPEKTSGYCRVGGRRSERERLSASSAPMPLQISARRCAAYCFIWSRGVIFAGTSPSSIFSAFSSI